MGWIWISNLFFFSRRRWRRLQHRKSVRMWCVWGLGSGLLHECVYGSDGDIEGCW
ncbi:hypothetical protein RchiOBHm_Chr3g0496851 [Rosa chinensis]|uniref:Uncharacterized protein n=1 Tax=Rosa chinensis TaxID=74649 RepID=A0A2P6RHK8_ROSCH|nr:hypothetical protein RchiOBHm_Chr3g0496851 [Rosa chinensis]